MWVVSDEEFENVMALEARDRLDYSLNKKWLPGLAADRRRVGVFPTPQAAGIVVSPEDLRAALRNALEAYET